MQVHTTYYFMVDDNFSIFDAKCVCTMPCSNYYYLSHKKTNVGTTFYSNCMRGHLLYLCKINPSWFLC